ncbi:hypothetical protein [Shewanella donghaensis]|uniref:hypothetical protein n=1 Tax=Shewanella donghaensis TaxID=238836 RepID=UPI001D046824|nr:hypothetical protein [Shewanella donghaensis]
MKFYERFITGIVIDSIAKLSKGIALSLLVSLSVSPPSVYAQAADIKQDINKDIENLDQMDVAVKIDENSFSCIRDMTPVRHFYVDNLLGNIEGTLSAANNPDGAIYPTGSVVQLVPTEVMVKREPGTFTSTADWEFFELEVSDEGSSIAKRGFVDVNNRFGGNCFTCHLPAAKKMGFYL